MDSSIIESDLSLVVPKKFQPAKDTQFYACSFCTINFEAIQICQFHEGSHDVNDKKSSRNFICRICQGSSQQTVSFPCWSKCSWHLWKTHGIDCELASCSEPECRVSSWYVAHGLIWIETFFISSLSRSLLTKFANTRGFILLNIASVVPHATKDLSSSNNLEHMRNIIYLKRRDFLLH